MHLDVASDQCSGCGALPGQQHADECPEYATLRARNTARAQDDADVRQQLGVVVEALRAVKRATGTSTEAHHLAACALHELGIEDFPYYRPAP